MECVCRVAWACIGYTSAWIRGPNITPKYLLCRGGSKTRSYDGCGSYALRRLFSGSQGESGMRRAARRLPSISIFISVPGAACSLFT